MPGIHIVSIELELAMNPWIRFQRVCLLIVLSLFLEYATASGQEWVARLSLPSGTMEETAVVAANATTTYIAGSILSAHGDWDIVLAAIDNNGDTLWMRQWDLGAEERTAGMIADNDGGVVLALTRWDSTGPTAYLARWSGSGSAHWYRAMSDGTNHTSAVGIGQLASGAIVLAFASDGGNGVRCGLSSVSVNGAEHWTIVTPRWHPRCLAVSPDAIAVGAWDPGNPDQASFLLYDANGTLKAQDGYSGAGSGRTLPVCLRHAADGFYLGGHAIGMDGSGMPFVLHYSDGGTRRWTTLPLPSAGRHRLVDLRPFPGGGIALTARDARAAGNHDIHLARLAADGGTVWEQSFDRTGSGTDGHAPLFGGALAATLSTDSVHVFWDAARDDVSGVDDLEYRVYLASTSGGHDFSTPAVSVTGITDTKIGIMPSATRIYIVVRTVDEAGNENGNIREVMVETGEERLRITAPPSREYNVCADVRDTLIASGGTPPYGWFIIAGELPVGCTLKSNGVISGSTATSGDYIATIRVRDSAGDTASAVLLFRVLPPERLVVGADLTLPGGAHCYSSLIVEAGATLRFDEATSVLLQDSLIVNGRITSACGELLFSSFTHALINGGIDNRCVSPVGGTPGDIRFVSETGSIEIHGSGILTDGNLLLIPAQDYPDWEIVVPPDARSPVSLPPVAEADADILNAFLPPGETIDVLFSLTGADPDGGRVRFDLDFGDGSVTRGVMTEDGEHAWVEKQYSRPGNYVVTVTVRDDEQDSSSVRLQLSVGDSLSDGSEGLGLSTGAGDIVLPRTEDVAFDIHAGLGRGLSIASVDWTFGDGATSTELSPVHRYSAPGRYEVRCSATDDSGNTALTTHAVYIYQPDTTVMGMAPGRPMPLAQDRTVLVDGPLHVTGRIVMHGFHHMWLTPNATVTTPNGAGGQPGSNGRGGSGISAYSPGWLVVNGATIRAGSGGNGGGNSVKGSFGKKGGKGGSCTLTGRNVSIGGGTIAAGDGGDGGDANVFKEAPGTAHAVGGRGGDAGGRVRVRGTNTVSFTGPTTIHTGNGGNGGDATATGGPGKSKCTIGEDGANAIARGGNGGKARKRGSVTGRVSGMSNVSLTGGLGGRGGSGTATGGRGGDADGCESVAVGGKGGFAIAWGGDGGESGHSGISISGAENFRPGDGGNATASGGHGGTGNAIPNPERGQDGCPGENGGDATGTGGNGGRSFASNGHKGKLSGQGQQAEPGSNTVNGSNGGLGAARGGTGGNGTDCDCDGGRGGHATAFGGQRGEMKIQAVDGGASNRNEGKDGNAMTLAGNGGSGGDCCTPPAPVGGDGGAGGNATSTPGPTGTGDAIAGNGGDGGDGKGPGVGGPGGIATVNGTAGLDLDGNKGEDGEWCFLIQTWYVYYSSIADGTISPGTDVTLGTYTAKDLATQAGNINVHFLTSAEAGGMMASYLKFGAELFIESGGMSIDFTSIQDVLQPGRHWDGSSFTIRFQHTGMVPGMATLVGYTGGAPVTSREVFLDPATPMHAETLAAPQGTFFDSVVLMTDSPVSFNHWEVEIIVVDP